MMGGVWKRGLALWLEHDHNNRAKRVEDTGVEEETDEPFRAITFDTLHAPSREWRPVDMQLL
jgi:hypothetical protein